MFYDHMAKKKAWVTNTINQINSEHKDAKQRFHETWELLIVTLNTVIHLT